MVILLQLNKIIFKKTENLEKKFSLASILTENCVFLKKLFSRFFLNCPGEISFGNLEKNPSKLHCQTLITLIVTQ